MFVIFPVSNYLDDIWLTLFGNLNPLDTLVDPRQRRFICAKPQMSKGRNMNEKPLYVAFIDNVCDPARPGRSGHSDIIWSLARNFAENGHVVKIIGPYLQDAALPFMHKNLSIVHFEEHPLANKNGFGMAANAFKASKMCRGKNYDYVFTSDAFSAGVASLYLRSLKVIFITSGNILQRQASDFKLDSLAEVSYRIVSFSSAHFSHRIIATSHDMKKWWIKTGAKVNKISIIPLGLNSSDFNRIPMCTNEGGLNLLFVGRLEGENNPLMLIDIASELNALGVKFTLNIVGDGGMKEQVINLIANKSLKNSVKLHGEVKFQDLPEIYSNNHIFLYTRQAGAPPRVILQALASGLCVIAFNTSGLEDYIIDSKMGSLMPYGDIKTLVEKVVEMDNDRPAMRSIGENAREKASQLFDWRVIYERYVSEITRI